MRIVLFVDYHPVSVSFEPALERIQGESLLVRTIRTLVSQHSDYPLSVVLSEASRGELARMVAELGVQSCRVHAVRKRQALAQAACEFEDHTLGVVSVWYGLGFVPSDLLDRLGAHHHDAGNSFTPVNGLPYPFVPELYQRDVLRDAALELPGLSSEPMEVLDALYRAQCATNDSSESVLACTPFQASTVYGLDPNWMPRRFEASLPDDVSRVFQAAGATEGMDWKQRLSALRALTVDDAERHGALPSVQRQRRHGPVRVLYVSTGSGYSGGESCLVSLIRSLDRTRFEPHALVPLDGWFADQLRMAGVEVVCSGRDFGPPRVENVVLFDRVVSELAPDILHLNGPAGLPVLAVSRLRGIPTVFHMRLEQLPGGTGFLPFVDRIISVSNFVTEQLACGLFETSKIRTIYDGVDCRAFHPDVIPAAEAKEHFGLRPGDFVVLCVARFSESKRHDVLLRAFRRLVERVPSARLLLVGEPSASCDVWSRCQRATAEWNLGQKVIFAGFQPDIRWAEAAADAVVLCSEREALGTVVMESMALGKPVIVAESGGLPELIVDNDCGLIVPPGDPESTAAALLKLAENPEYRRRIGLAGRLRAESRFSIEISAAAVSDLYKDLMAQTPDHERPRRHLGPASSAVVAAR